MTKVGLDFGTTHSKISYFDPNGQLKLFRYPASEGREFIPTAVSYYKDAVFIGSEAKSAYANEEGVTYYQSPKMLLPIENDDDIVKQGWSRGKTPTEVTLDFLQKLLRTATESFINRVGSIEGLVVSVPEVWQQDVRNRGREKLRKILQDDLELPLSQLISEPVCAAAYYAYKYGQTHERLDWANLLVCDVGGGTFDVALCKVTEYETTVLGRRAKRYTITVLDWDGTGRSGFNSAGVSYDHAVVLAAYHAAEGIEQNPSESEFVDLLQQFEDTKIRMHDEACIRFNEARQRPALGDIPLYTVKRKYRVTVKQAQQAFIDINKGITGILKTMRDRMSQNGWSIDRLAIVGGFGQFPLVEQAVLDCLGMDNHDQRFDRNLLLEDRLYAVAYGTALIANGIIDPPVEYYPHTLGIIYTELLPVIREGFLPILIAGKSQSGQLATTFATNESNEPIVFVVNNHTHPRSPVFLRVRGTSEPYEIKIADSNLPAQGRYHIGAYVDKSNLGWLVFRPVDGGKDVIYNLGDVNPIITRE